MTPEDNHPPKGEKERRCDLRRGEDEWLVNYALREHAWIKRVAVAALMCCVVLAILDGIVVWELQAATGRAHSLADTARQVGVSNRNVLHQIQVSRQRRIKDAQKTALEICQQVKHTNDALIEFLITNERLSRRVHVPGITDGQRRRTRRQEHRLIHSLTITCTQQGKPRGGG